MSLDVLQEIGFLLPDSLVFGSFLVGITTLSLQHVIFFFSLLESLVALKGLNTIFAHILGHESVYTIIFDVQRFNVY